MAALVILHPGAFVDATVQWFVRAVGAIVFLVTNQIVGNAFLRASTLELRVTASGVGEVCKSKNDSKLRIRLFQQN